MKPIRAGMGMYERIPEGVRAYEVAFEAYESEGRSPLERA
jgi:hypothetical protein